MPVCIGSAFPATCVCGEMYFLGSWIFILEAPSVHEDPATPQPKNVKDSGLSVI